MLLVAVTRADVSSGCGSVHLDPRLKFCVGCVLLTPVYVSRVAWLCPVLLSSRMSCALS
jgi:hypothetical protein